LEENGEKRRRKLNLKGREDQNGAKLAEKHNMHRRKHERAVGRA
jgi:hypothetical protein